MPELWIRSDKLSIRIPYYYAYRTMYGGYELYSTSGKVADITVIPSETLKLQIVIHNSYDVIIVVNNEELSREILSQLSYVL